MKKSKSRGMWRIAALLTLSCFLTLTSFGQRKTLSGTVVGSDGVPIPGATVVVLGTTTGTVSDLDGKFSFSAPADAKSLSFAFVGMISQVMVIGNQTNFNITMLSESTGVDEVVVVGYGTRLKEELTGSISTVSKKQLAISSATNVISRMQGQVSGVTVTNSNTPGGDAFIRVRGMGTINDSKPLYVIDGVPGDPGSSLNPNDIESISILKDASSSAIYGTRGANGVILITTKRGKASDKPTITFSSRVGVSKAINQYDMLNAQEYAQSVWLREDNKGKPRPSALYGTGSTPVLPDYLTPVGAKEGDPGTDPSTYSNSNVITKANKAGTNWYDQIYQAGKTQEYDLSISGGSQKSTYAFSAGYADQQGILIHTDFKRYTFRSNSDVKVADWLKFGQSLSATFTVKQGDMGNDGEASPISQAYRIQPIIPVYDIKGNFAGTKSGPNFGNAENPVAQLTRNANNYDKYARAMGNFYGEATLIKGLNFKSLFGFDYGTTDQKYVTLRNPEKSEANANDALAINHNYTMQWNWVNTLSYDKTFGVHRISAVIGTEAISNVYTEGNAGRSVYSYNDFDYMQLNSGESPNQTNSGYVSEWSLFSQFGRLNYSMNGKYLLEGVVRRDGSSRFDKVIRYGIFPAVSAGWVISQENFMSSTSHVINFLKLKGGWGKSGNDRIGNYNSFTTFSLNKIQSSYPLDGTSTGLTIGFQPFQYGNTNVTWEKTSTLDIGLDARFLNNTLSFGIDIWQRKTTDMLYNPNKPQVAGVALPPYLNIGDMKNTGFDLELGISNNAKSHKFVYSVNATLSHYKNEVTKLGAPFYTTASERQVDYSRATAGHAFPEFYGYVVDGIFQTQAEADAWPTYGSYNKPGHFKYRDISGPDGKPDGKITDADRTYLGSPHPKLTGGLNINLAYGGFDINAVFYGSYGNKMINYVKRWIDYGQFDGGLSKDALYKSWGSPYLKNNADATLPMYDISSISQQNSSAFVEDASYLRLKNLQIGYNLPKSIVSKWKMENVNIYGQVTNLFTITKYSGLDPEYFSSDPRTLGLDRGAVPTSRQVMFGLRLTL